MLRLGASNRGPQRIRERRVQTSGGSDRGQDRERFRGHADTPVQRRSLGLSRRGVGILVAPLLTLLTACIGLPNEPGGFELVSASDARIQLDLEARTFAADGVSIALSDCSTELVRCFRGDAGFVLAVPRFCGERGDKGTSEMIKMRELALFQLSPHSGEAVFASWDGKFAYTYFPGKGISEMFYDPLGGLGDIALSSRWEEESPRFSYRPAERYILGCR